MAGYRDTSSYEPFPRESAERPVWPFNWVQWTGVVLAAIGLGIDLVYFAGRFGWINSSMATPTYAIGPLILGVTLVNSRRQSDTDLAPELAAARKRWLIMIAVTSAAILGAATLIDIARS
jgi:hypothetical protein